jgi:hypothetical protein
MAKKKNPNAVALGKLGGSKGGKIRAFKLTPEKRSEIARNAVLARWAKSKKKVQGKDMRMKPDLSSNIADKQNQAGPLSDAPASGKSAVAVAGSESATRLSEEMNSFLKQLFAQGRFLEESFGRICRDGCPREEFGTLLYVHCLVSSFREDPDHFPRDRKRLVNSGNIPKSQLKSVPRRMRAVADTIESINATILAPANDIKLAPYDAQRQIAREYLIRRYETLPGILRLYSWHLEKFSKFASRTAKRITPGQVNAVELVRYVEDHTGSPHYEDVSNLLDQGWRVAGRRLARRRDAGEPQSTPRFLSTAGLTKLYQRWAKYVCGPRRTAGS